MDPAEVTLGGVALPVGDSSMEAPRPRGKEGGRWSGGPPGNGRVCMVSSPTSARAVKEKTEF